MGARPLLLSGIAGNFKAYELARNYILVTISPHSVRVGAPLAYSGLALETLDTFSSIVQFWLQWGWYILDVIPTANCLKFINSLKRLVIGLKHSVKNYGILMQTSELLPSQRIGLWNPRDLHCVDQPRNLNL